MPKYLDMKISPRVMMAVFPRYLRDPVEESPVTIFRFLFGITQFIQITRMFYYNRIDDWFVKPGVRFTYTGFEWVPLLSDGYVHVQYCCMALTSLVFAFGHAPLISSATFALFQIMFFFSDRTLYNNHYYLALLLAFHFLLCDIHRVASRLSAPSAMRCIPRWYLLTFQVQLAVVYAFATLAKLSSGDWLRAYPAREWLQEGFEDAVRQVYGDDVRPRAHHFLPLSLAYALSYGGIVVDAFITFACFRATMPSRHTLPSLPLFCRRSDKCDDGAAEKRGDLCDNVMCLFWISFHTLNWFLFDIGVFPLMMLASLCLFFDFRTFWNCRIWSSISFLVQRGGNVRRRRRRRRRSKFDSTSRATTADAVALATLFFFYMLQIFLPLRFLIHQSLPSRHVNWTGNGEMFAWRMMLTSKQCDGRFDVVSVRVAEDVVDKEHSSSSDVSLVVSYRSHEDLGLHFLQWWRMISDAEHVRQMSVVLRERFEAIRPLQDIYERYEVRVRIFCSLNGARAQRFVDDGVDFSSVTRGDVYTHVLDQFSFPP